MKVYLVDDNGQRLVGRADVPANVGPVYEVPMFNAAPVLTERFAIGSVTRLPAGGGAPVTERVVLASPGQPVELLPGWKPLTTPVASNPARDRGRPTRPDAETRHERELAALQGEVCALRGVIAVLISHVALLGRNPHAKREEILRSLESMLPGALARIEHDAPPAAAAGFERAVETLTHLARTAVRFEPTKPGAQGAAAKRTLCRDHDPDA